MLFTSPVPANITVPPSSTWKSLRDDVTMTCTAFGFPVPSISWFKQNKPVTETERVNINQTVTEENLMITSTLRFDRIIREDTGAYSCKAENLVGSSQSWANLTVLGKYLFKLLFFSILVSEVGDL